MACYYSYIGRRVLVLLPEIQIHFLTGIPPLAGWGGETGLKLSGNMKSVTNSLNQEEKQSLLRGVVISVGGAVLAFAALMFAPNLLSDPELARQCQALSQELVTKFGGYFTGATLLAQNGINFLRLWKQGASRGTSSKKAKSS